MISLEDESGKNRFVCNVIVDSIATLNIVTTTRELYIEEAPEAFEVRAYDDQGSYFNNTLQLINLKILYLVMQLKPNLTLV